MPCTDSCSLSSSSSHVHFSSGPCVNLPLHWHGLVAVTLEECPGVNDGFLLMLLSKAHSLLSLGVVRCDAVTASGFASVVCTRLCQLEIVRCAVVEPDVVMDASVRSVGRSLSALNISHARLGVLQLNHLEFISILVVDMCNGFTTTAASAVVANCRVLRLLSAAGVMAFTSLNVRHEYFRKSKRVTMCPGVDANARAAAGVCASDLRQ